MASKTYKVGYKAATKEIQIKHNSENLEAGFVSWGTINHDPVGKSALDTTDGRGSGHSHSLYHHIRDLCYDHDILDMQSVSILFDENVNLTGIALNLAGPVAKTVGQTEQLTVAFTPTDATNQNVVWSTSDATKATVSQTGLVTAVAAGSATITVTSRDGALTDTVVFNIT